MTNTQIKRARLGLASLLALVVASLAFAAAMGLGALGKSPLLLLAAVSAAGVGIAGALYLLPAVLSAPAQLRRTYETSTLAFPPPSAHGPARLRRVK